MLFLCLVDHTLQDTPKMFLLLKWDVIFLKIPFFLLLQLNGTRLTKISENQKVLISLKKVLNLYGHLKTEFITAIILKESNY